MKNQHKTNNKLMK